ncbi:MAG: tRNA (adenosine(37)-N6)-dimethylallyltransferase MiaA [Clostridiales bacterium]|nr:tRNA (adenosine(37)-N6)-dimethylallyltransferase MiaA [Clostridiales bacterium]
MIKLLFVAGPTACGKTEYALRLAKDLGGEIVSADSMQIYKYMNIGSAKPDAEELAAVRHWLVDEIEPSEGFSVADYQSLARRYISEINSRGKLPIVSGGTGLYINSLLYDMDFPGCKGDDERRQEIWEECERDGEKLAERLRRLDSAAAEKIHPNNIKRMLRAVERLEGGEDSLAAFADVKKPAEGYDTLLIALARNREELYDRINLRVDKIIDSGLENEVRSLMAMGLTSADVAMKGIGYKEVIDAIEAGRSAEDASELIKKNTRHYARRQIIWLRRYPQLKKIKLEGDAFDEAAYASMRELIEEWLQN